jgi:hypothetical protein
VDEGLPIAYQVLDSGVPVHAAGGEAVGSVDHVVAAPAEDIFHGIVLRTSSGLKFVAADQIRELHERGVDLRIGVDEIPGLPDPHGAAPARRIHEPGVRPSHWKQILDLISGAQPHRRDWTDEE